MTRLIVVTLFAAAALTGPVFSQQKSSELGDVSAPLDSSVSSDASAPSPDELPSTSEQVPVDTGARFDIDNGLSLDFNAERAGRFRQILIDSGARAIEATTDASVGSSVPTSVVMSPLPVAVLAEFPRLEGYLYFMLSDGRIAVVSPTTLKIVLVIYG